MQSLECVELLLFVLLPKMSVPDITNLGLVNILYSDIKLGDKITSIVMGTAYNK